MSGRAPPQVTWSAAVDLVLALSLLNLVPYGRFYFENGEGYFASSWGFFALLWDGTAHYVLQASRPLLHTPLASYTPPLASSSSDAPPLGLPVTLAWPSPPHPLSSHPTLAAVARAPHPLRSALPHRRPFLGGKHHQLHAGDYH